MVFCHSLDCYPTSTHVSFHKRTTSRSIVQMLRYLSTSLQTWFLNRRWYPFLNLFCWNHCTFFLQRYWHVTFWHQSESHLTGVAPLCWRRATFQNKSSSLTSRELVISVFWKHLSRLGRKPSFWNDDDNECDDDSETWKTIGDKLLTSNRTAFVRFFQNLYS